MTESVTDTTNVTQTTELNETTTTEESSGEQVKDSYVKLAMRNMVKKKGISLNHFFLTTIGLLGFLIGVSYLTR